MMDSKKTNKTNSEIAPFQKAEVLLSAFRSIIGLVTGNMRMVKFEFDESAAKFIYYFENEPGELDKELAEVAAVNFDAGQGKWLKRLDVEFTCNPAPLGQLAGAGHTIYRRYEEHL